MIVTLGIYVFSVASFGQTNFKIRLFNYGIYLTYISLVLLTIFVFLYAFLYGDFKLKISTLLIPLFAATAFIGTALYSKQFREWATLVFLSFSFLVLLYCFKSLQNKYLIIITISLALFLFTIFYIFYYLKDLLDVSSIVSGKIRLGYDFDNQNGVAAYAAVSFGLSTYLLLFIKKKIRFIFLLQILSSFIVGISTGSRTFFVTCFVFLLIYSFFAFRKHKWIYLISIGTLIVVTAILLSLPTFSFIKQRLLDALGTIFGTATRYDNATVERVTWIDYGIVMGSKNLLFGYGSLGFSIYSGVGTYSHSNYAEVLCDFGIIGFIIFYLPLFLAVYRSIIYKKIDKPFLFGFISYYLLVSFSNVLYYKKMYYIVLSLIFYLAYYDNTFAIKRKIGQPKSIVFVCDTMGSGGAEKVISVLSNEFVNIDIDVTIVGVGDRGSGGPFYELKESIRYVPLLENHSINNPLLKIIKLRRLLKKIKPDCVISFLPNGNIYACFSLFFLDIPHLTSERNNPYVDPKGIFQRVLKRFAFSLSDVSVFQTKESMHFYGNKIVKRSHIIKNPVSLRIKPPINYQQRNNVILSVGRLTEQKNYYCMIDAFESFNKRHNYSYYLKIYGDGPLHNELFLYSNAKNIGNRVIFVGNDKEWHSKEYLDAVFLLSSNYEGFPNALLEAMALGIPSVSTDCQTGGPRELIKDGYNGFLVEVNNREEMALKMDEAIEKSEQIFLNTRKIIDEYSPLSISSSWLNSIKTIEKDFYE